MSTEREALNEIRKSIIESRMAGKSDLIKQRALRDFERMNFDDHADFISYVDECAGATTENETEADTDTVDAIMAHLSPTNGYTKKYVPKAGEASEAEIEAIFKHL